MYLEVKEIEVILIFLFVKMFFYIFYNEIFAFIIKWHSKGYPKKKKKDIRFRKVTLN